MRASLSLANFNLCAKLGLSVMHKITIISPDPDTRRILELAFDLKGFSPKTVVDIPRSGTDDDLILLDLVRDGGKSVHVTPKAMAGQKGKAGKLVVLLPRGSGAKEPEKWKDRADLIVKKPYELLSLIDSVEELAKGKKTNVIIPKKSSSYRRTPRRRSSSPRRRT